MHIVVVFKQIFRRIFKSSKVQTRNNLVSIISDKKQQHSQLQMVRYKQNKACLQILLAALGWSWFGKAYGRKIRWRKTCLPYWFLCPETNIRSYIAKVENVLFKVCRMRAYFLHGHWHQPFKTGFLNRIWRFDLPSYHRLVVLTDNQ